MKSVQPSVNDFVLRPASGRSRPKAVEPALVDEVLIADVRAALMPAELVDRKLEHLLRGRPLGISHTQRGVSRDRARTRG